MLKLFRALRQDEYGVILSTEIVIIGSLLVIGLITGISCLQKSVNSELRDLAGAIDAIDQSYAWSSHRKAGVAGQCCAWTAGSSFVNCEGRADARVDMVGSSTAITGTCCQTDHCAGCEGREVTRSAEGVCGSCGGCGTGCGVCGSVSAGVLKSGCLETDIPKMKITEWPLSEPESACPPAVTSECPAANSNLIPAPICDPAVGTTVIESGPQEILIPSQPEKAPADAAAVPASPATPDPKPSPATEPLPRPQPI